VVGDGRICVTDKKGDVHALDLNGKPVWTKSFLMPSRNGRPPTPVDFDAPLALFDSTLIACTAAGRVYALDVANGDMRWERNLDFPILGTPNVATVQVDGAPQKRLFVIDQSEGALQCLDFASGKPLWKGKGPARCDGSAAVNGAMAVYGSCAGAVHIFSTVNGDLLREITLDEDSQVAGGVVLLGDSVFSGSRSGKFIDANVQTAAVNWTNTDCDGEAFSTPAVSADRVVFTANDSIVYALDRQSGALKWKQKLDDTASSPVIVGDKIVTAAAGTLYLLQLSDGKKLWSYAVSDEITSPALAGALVVVGAEDGSVTAFGRKVGE
jgi:outer membrane protein assembly factor BamB